MAKIIVVGSINMDLVVRAPHIPIPGETVLGSDFGTFPGGKGANQAVAAARQGASVAFIGRVGDDAFGSQLVAGLQAEGVDVQEISVDKNAATGVALITLDEAGQNSIVVASGANYSLEPEKIRVAENAFQDADMLLLQLESPLETVIAAAEVARRHSVRVVLNPAPAQPLPDEFLSMVDVLIPNESETALLTGLPVETLAQAETAAREILGQGVGCIVFTLGSQGALLVQHGRPAVHIPGFPVSVVDTTAAGDSFVGAFSVALAAGSDLESAVQRGCAAGALTTTRMGAQPAIPTKAEIEEFLDERSAG
jgi:ribokinase